MSKYRPFFLSDAAEHLEGLEKELIALEQRPSELERLDEIFRHLHSLKGLAASMQYPAMSRLAHRMEDMVEIHRQNKTAPGPQASQLLMQGMDLLRGQLENIRRNESPAEPPAEFLTKFESLLPARPSASPIPTTSASEAETPPRACAATWTVTVTIAPDSLAPAARALLVLKAIGRLGRVVTCRPPREQLRTGNLPERKLVVELHAECDRHQLLTLSNSMAEIEAVEVTTTPVPSPAAQPLQLPTVRVETELLDFFFDSVSELGILLGRLESLGQQSSDLPLLREVTQLGRLVRRLYERIAEVRLVPVSLLTGRLARTCRDLARSLGKQVELTIEGEEVKFDRSLIEILDAPLLHLVRNSLGHGIEAPAARRAAGKNESGHIRLAFSRSGERVQVVVEDDGAGIDEEKVRQKAARLGLPIPQRHDWLWEIISRPAFTTREQVDQLSGRGVGLDAVRRAVEQAGGRIRLETQPGRGTTFFIDLPLSVSIVPVLLIQQAGALLALPAGRAQRVLLLDNLPRGGANRVQLAERELPLVELGHLLCHQQPCASQEGVLLEENGQPFLLGVEHILGYRQVVLRRPGRILRQLGPFAGTAVLGDGRPLLLLDVPAMMAAGRHP